MKKFGCSSILVVAVLLAVAVIAEAQQPGKVPLVGYVSSNTPSSPGPCSVPSGKDCAILVISRGKTFTLSTAILRERMVAPQAL